MESSSEKELEREGGGVETEARGGGGGKQVSHIAKDRENLVEVAVKFLNNPRVMDSPLDQKKAFLRKKGLSDGEIDEAVRLSQLAPPPPPPRTPSHSLLTPHHSPPPHRPWRDYALAVTVLGGVGYALYKFIRNFVIPWLSQRLEQSERVDDINVAIRQIQSNLDTTVAGLSETTNSIRDSLNQQQQQIENISTRLSSLQASVPGSVLAVKEIKDEMSSLKGLLLNRHQFPIPSAATNTPSQRGIPSWQRSSQQQQQQQQETVTFVKGTEEEGEGGGGEKEEKSSESEKGEDEH